MLAVAVAESGTPEVVSTPPDTVPIVELSTIPAVIPDVPVGALVLAGAAPE